MKNVFNKHQCIHLWAQQTQQSGRMPVTSHRDGSRATSNVSFDGQSLYSFEHYKIARIVPTLRKRPKVNDGPLVLIQTNMYSSTTAGHIHAASAATRHMSRISVPNLNPEDDHTVNIMYFLEHIEGFKKKLQSARINNAYMAERVNRQIADAKIYARHFMLRVKFPEPYSETDLNEFEARDVAYRAKVTDKSAEKQVERAKRQAKEREHYIIKAEKTMSDWIACGFAPGISAASDALNRTALRVQHEMVQTSRGAEIPIADGVRALWLVRRCMAGRTGWYCTDGRHCRVGHFTITSVTPEGTVTAGCHTIIWKELERIAPELDAYRDKPMPTDVPALSRIQNEAGL